MRILVIEDEPELRRVLVQALEEAGCAVDDAGDGNRGLNKALTWPYDAIVLDLMLPGMDGWTLLSTLRQTSATPVLILTARDSVDDRVRGLDSGADDYLVKPFAIDELLARLRALIRRSTGQSSSTVQIGPLEIDLAKRIVAREGVIVDLTAREFSLVEMLVLNQGRLVTRTQIYDHIFGEDDDSLSNLVDVHISHIRKKLGAGFIRTRRGQGYIVEG